MKTLTNIKVINKIKGIVRAIIIGSFVCFGIAVFLLFKYSFQSAPFVYFISIILLIAAYTLFRVYIFLTSRYGASPRLDERLASILKGLSDEYYLFNYIFEVPHVLMSNSQIWLLELYEVSGSVSYDNQINKWFYKKGGKFITKFFSTDTFRNPQKDISYLQKDWGDSIKKIETHNMDNFTKLDRPEIVLVFMNTDINLSVQESEFPAIKADRLKDFIRKNTTKKTDQQKLVSKLISGVQKFV